MRSAVLVASALFACNGPTTSPLPGPGPTPVDGAPADAVGAVDGAARADASPSLDAALPVDAASSIDSGAPACAVAQVMRWSGTAARANTQDYPDRINATATWQLAGSNGCIDTYVPSGHVTYWWASPGSPCDQAIAPADQAIAAGDGTLTIDRTAAPATYTAHATTTWPVTWTCTYSDGTTQTQALTGGGVWLDASGNVAGSSIAGDFTVEDDQARCGSPNGVAPCRYTWSFTAM